MDIIRIPLKHYIYVSDNIKNITYLVEGPCTYALKGHESLAKDKTPFIQLGNSQYVNILNPAVRNSKGEVQFEDFGQVKLSWGEELIVTDSDREEPFPLYPGEELKTGPSNFIVVEANNEIKLKAERCFHDDIKKKDRKPGDIWMVRGPFNYIPRVETTILEKIKAYIIKPNSALRVKAIMDCVGKDGVTRKAGEEWLIREAGSYLPNVEEVVTNACVQAITLTDNWAIQLKATSDFKDIYKNTRKAGEEWLVTIENSDSHIPDIHEILVKKVKITVLSSRQYCIIRDPVIDDKIQYGKRMLKKGECHFFLLPGESLESGIQEVTILDENESLLLRAREDYNDGTKPRYAGDRWLIKGPCEFIQPLELDIIEKRKGIPLDENEGIYVRDIYTGEVTIITGTTYLLKAHEELWEKELSPDVEALIASQYSGTIFQTAEINEKGEYDYKKAKNVYKRIKHKVVTFRAPHNSAVQVFDYKSNKGRVVFGPELIKLSPHEQFTLVKLSGKKPKVEDQIRNLAILLGPDFMSDIIEVETKDHARLALQLCYSWKFEVDKTNEAECEKIFAVNDFIGGACKILAAKIRGSVSSVAFEIFHKNSANIVKSAVFGTDENGNLKSHLKFESNNLIITNVDIQSQDPTDSQTRENLNKSTNLSILHINAIQKADANHKQKIFSEDSNGKLKLQEQEDDIHAENVNIEYLKKKIETDAVKTTGELKAKANARAKGNVIEGNSKKEQAKLHVEAQEIEVMSALIEKEENIKSEINRQEQIIDIELEKMKQIHSIEIEEFKQTINAIGKSTIVSMARAGPETQANMLKALGIKSFLISDGKNPINLFNSARGLVVKPNK